MTIRKFNHKGLKKFFASEDKSGILPALSQKVEMILDRLDSANDPKDMNYPGSDFHRLKGNLKEFYSVHVNGNWVIIFKFENGDAHDVDLIDYH
jgi:toxin HigB-1